MTNSLTDRIRDALNGGKSAGMAALIAEVQAAAVQSVEASKAARKRALDAALTNDEAAEARKDSEDALFDADRMSQAEVALREALKTFLAAEDAQQGARIYAAAKRKRDAAVSRIQDRYATLANELGMLMSAANEADAAVAEANRVKPFGAAHLPTVDYALRGFYPGVGDDSVVRRLADAVVLPSLDHKQRTIWGNGGSFHPDRETAAVPSADAVQTEGAGSSAPALSVVRLSMRDAGEAA